MATITIIGTADENEKVENLVKTEFDRVISKAKTKCDAGEMLVIDAYTSEQCEINGYTDKEILKALKCCSDSVKNCKDCPYTKENNCSTKVLMDSALIVHRMLEFVVYI